MSKNKKSNKKINLLLIIGIVIMAIVTISLFFVNGRDGKVETINKKLKSSIVTSEDTITLDIENKTAFTPESNKDNLHVETVTTKYSSFINKEKEFTLQDTSPKSKSSIKKNNFSLVWVFNKNLDNSEDSIKAIKNNLTLLIDNTNITPLADIHIHGNIVEVLINISHTFGELKVEMKNAIIKSEEGQIYNSKITDTFTIVKNESITYKNYNFSETIEGQKVVELYFDTLINIKENGIHLYINDKKPKFEYRINTNSITIITDSIKENDDIIIHIPKENYTFSDKEEKGTNDINFVLKAK